MGGDASAGDRGDSIDPMSVPFSSGVDAHNESHAAAGRDEPMQSAEPMRAAEPMRGAKSMQAHEPSRQSEREPRREASTDPWRAQAPAESAPVADRGDERVSQPPARVAPAEPYALPLDSLVAVAESAGLQWVNSDAAKIEAAQAAMATAAEPIRVQRDIPPVAAVDDGPLVLVETKKDLSTVKLPFETTPRETQGI